MNTTLPKPQVDTSLLPMIHYNGITKQGATMPTKATLLLQKFMHEAGISSPVHMKVHGLNHHITFDRDGVKINLYHGSCHIILRAGGRDQEYGGHVNVEGMRPESLYATLSKITVKGFWYDDEPKKNGAHHHPPEASAVTTATATNGHEHNGSLPPSIPEEKLTAKMPLAEAATADQQPEATMPPANKSMKGWSKDLVLRTLIIEAITELYPSGIVPAAGLSTSLVAKLELDCLPRAIGPVISGIAKVKDSGLVIHKENPLTYRLTAIVPDPPAEKSKPATSGPKQKVALAPIASTTDTSGLLAQLNQASLLAAEHAKATAEIAVAMSNIEKVDAEVESIKRQIEQLEHQAVLLGENLQAHKIEHGRLLAIIESPAHKDALMIMKVIKQAQC